KLRRCRKAIERRAEHGAGVRAASPRAMEFCQSERGAELEAASPLMSRDGDRGKERLLDGRIGGILPEKDFAAHAVELRVEPALSAPFEVVQRTVERSQRGGRLAVPRLRFR